MIKILVYTTDNKHKADIQIEGKRVNLKGEFITLLEALESKEQSRELLHHAIDVRIEQMFKELKDLDN